MKIAVFHNLSSGGAKRALFNNCRYLSESGHKLSLTIPDTANEDYLSLKEFVHDVKIISTPRSLYNAAGFCMRNQINPLFFTSKTMRRLISIEASQREIAKFINKQDYDFVFVEQSGFLYSPFLLRYLEKPSIYSCQQPLRFNEDILQKKRGRIRSGKFAKLMDMDRENASSADLIITNSCYTREMVLREYGLESFVSYLGIDEKRFRPLHSQRRNFILSVGAIQPAKGFDFIVSTIAKIDKRIRPKVLIIGNHYNPKEKGYLESIAKKSDIDLEIKVMINEKELIEMYNTARVFAYASHLEPFGLVVLEAMACGTPVIAVKEGGVRESVIDGETGFLVDRDVQDFADALTSLLTDDKKRQEMGLRAREVIEDKWTIRRAGDRLMGNINRLLRK